MLKKAAALSALSCVLTLTAAADWKADMHIKTPAHGPNAPSEMSGKAQGTASAMRMDMEGPRGSMSVISDWKKRKVWNLMHQQKMYMETSLDRVGVQLPACSNDDIESCLTHEGFKKTGSQDANGHSCAHYEKDTTLAGGKKSHIELWHPTDVKGVPIVRSRNTSEGGAQSQVDFTNITVVSSLSSDLFMPPSDYKTMGLGAGRPPGPGGSGPGGMPPRGPMTPEQAMKMREEMMKKFGGARPEGQ